MGGLGRCAQETRKHFRDGGEGGAFENDFLKWFMSSSTAPRGELVWILILFIFRCIHVLLAHTCMQCQYVDARRGHSIPWPWSYRQKSWVMDAKPGSSPEQLVLLTANPSLSPQDVLLFLFYYDEQTVGLLTPASPQIHVMYVLYKHDS